MKDHRYILGQLFSMWDVRLDATHLGSLTAGGGRTLTAYVNGNRVAGNPAGIELAAHQEIALVYGTEPDPPKLPVGYSFPSGE